MTETDKAIDNLKFEDETAAPTKKEKSKIKEKLNTKKSEHGFMYIGHLPHGFYEEQLKSYFSQFGKVVKIRLARSIKTGNRKGYGFIEFENVDVAKIAAETMNNYLMFNRLLKCHLIPKEKLHKFTFRNARKPFKLRLKSDFRKKFNAKKSVEQIKKLKEKQNKNFLKKQQKLESLGINLDLSKMLYRKKSTVEDVTQKPKKLEAKEEKPATKPQKVSKKQQPETTEKETKTSKQKKPSSETSSSQKSKKLKK